MNTAKQLTIAAALAACLGALPAQAQQDEREEEETQRTTADAAEQVGDAWITTKVKADLLATEGVTGTAIDVDTEDGVVTLNGTVATRAEEDKAVEVAKGIKGVTRVESKLKIEPPAY